MNLFKKKALSVVLAASMLFGATVTMTGCFGSFSFTRTVWEINRDISNNRFVQWLVFLGLSILPVYEVALLIDVLVTNSLEFWSGERIAENGEEPPKTKVVELSSDRKALLERIEDKHVRVTIYEGDQIERKFVLDGRNDSLMVRDEDGDVLGAARDAEDGGVLVTDGEGKVIEHHDANAVDQLHDSIRKEGPDGAVEFANDYRDDQDSARDLMIGSLP